MPSRLYYPKLICVNVMRVVLAAGLALALLAGVVPASLSSAQQTCTMSCCAGKPLHVAGSCRHAFSEDSETQTHSVTASEEHHHAEATETNGTTAPEIIEADASTSSHCGTNAHSSTESASTARAARPPQPPSIKAHVLIRPCSPECAAAAVSNLSQVRRGRSVAVLTANHRPRPPTRASLSEQTFDLQTSPAVICRQSRPRAPPTASHQNPSA